MVLLVLLLLGFLVVVVPTEFRISTFELKMYHKFENICIHGSLVVGFSDVSPCSSVVGSCEDGSGALVVASLTKKKMAFLNCELI